MGRLSVRHSGIAALVLTLSVSSVACLGLGDLLNQFAPTGTTKTSASTTGLRVTAATAGVDVSSFSGPCPKRLTFTGTITASEAGEVTYKWERHDGSAAPTQTMTFNAGSSQTVSTVWDVSPSTSGWQRLHVVTPNDLTSNEARIIVTCQ
jgi:hypothetical protein